MKLKDNMGYREYLLSDENIYLSIYSLNSYVFEYDLLDANDRELYHSLQEIIYNNQLKISSKNQLC